MIAARPQGSSGPMYNPERDLGHLFPVIFMETAQILQIEFQEDRARLSILNDLTLEFVALYETFLTDRGAGIRRYRKLVERCAADPAFADVYSRHAVALQQVLFAVMFSHRHFPIASTALARSTYSEVCGINNLAAALSPNTLQLVLNELDAAGMIPQDMNWKILLRYTGVVEQRIEAQEVAHEARDQKAGLPAGGAGGTAAGT